MKKIFWIFLIALVACSPTTETIEVRNEAGQVLEKFTQNIKTKEKEGKSEFFAPDGTLLEEANYVNGQLHGDRKLYRENGTLAVIEKHESGEFKGLYQSFYENGQVDVEGVYTNGMMGGKWKRYYDSGELMEIVTFVENEENGPFIEYYKNGNLKAEGNYLNGDDEHGALKLYNEEGVLTKKMDCDKGRCHTTWTKEEGEKNI